MDSTPQPEVVMPKTDYVETNVGEYTDVELGDFLSRPIRIATIPWSYATNINGSMNPWALYFNNTVIKNRLAYYNLLKCNLCVKIVVNGNAFQYGKMTWDWLPFSDSSAYGGTSMVDNFSVTDTSAVYYFNAASHRPYVSISPLDSQGACMELPFFWPNNFMSIPNEDWYEMGNLRYFTLNPVLHANTELPTDPPIITVFAWAKDVKISVPTSLAPLTLQPQAGDETYGKVSGPMTSIASVAGSMGKVPVIGPYATATSTIAKAIGSVAKMFGYARPPIETPMAPMRPDYIGNLANTDRPELVQKLTLDSSQEVTIDPGITGVNFGDELSIKSIAGRETYLDTFTWNYSQGADAFLWNVMVTPLLYKLIPDYTVTKALYPTALAYASFPFRYWRGSLKFRFEVVCSKFHRGRLRLLYDPKAVPNVADFNKNYQTILDLDESTDLTVEVHWCSDRMALYVGAVNFTSIQYGTVPLGPNSSSNGGLYLYVLNNLSVPTTAVASASNLAYVNVYVSAGDDFEVAVPDSVNMDLMSITEPFTPAAGMEVYGSKKPTYFEVGTSSSSRNMDLGIFGEKVVTFRSILKRYFDYLAVSLAGGSTATTLYFVSWLNRRFPLYPGNDAAGINTITNLLTTGSFPGNNYRMNPLVYLMSAFSGCRGSFRYKYMFMLNNASGSSNNNCLIACTRQNAIASGVVTYSASGTSSPLTTTTAQAAFKKMSSSWNGATAIVPSRSPIMEIEDPYYERYKFVNPKMLKNNTTSHFGGHSLQIPLFGQVNTAATNLALSYVSTGEDFNLMFYTGPPILWTSAYY